MFAKIAYKQNINMWKTNFSLQHLTLLLGTEQKRLLQIMFYYIFSLILEFRNFKFPELENWELQVPGAWELRNLLKGIPCVRDLSKSAGNCQTKTVYPSLCLVKSIMH